RRCSTRRSPSSPTSMTACARSTCATRISRRRSATSSRRSRKQPTNAASRSMEWTAARPRSRATTWKPPTAATSTWSIAPIPACIFWRGPARRARSRDCHKARFRSRGSTAPESASHLAVEPSNAVVSLLRRARAEHLIAQLRCRPARMVEVAVDARHDLHPRGAEVTLLHIGPECRRQIVRILAGFVGEPDRVLRGHAGALRQVLQHGVGGVAQKRHPPFAPFLHWLAVAQHPHAPSLDALEHAQDLGTLALKMGPQFAGIRLRIPALDVTLGVEHGNEVVDLAAAQRVMDEMGTRTSP